MDLSCTICQSKKNEIRDGLLYCLTCNSQITTFLEYEVDDSSIAATGRFKVRQKVIRNVEQLGIDDTELQTTGVQKIKKRKGFRGEIEISKEFESKSKTVSRLKKTNLHSKSEVAEHLANIGRRLLTVTKIIVKITRTLVDEYNFPAELPETCLTYWQLYLQHCKIAFHDEEYECELDNMYRALIERKISEGEQKRTKRERDKRKQERAKTAFNKSSNPLALLLSTNIDENLGMSSDEENTDDMKKIKKPAAEQYTIDVLPTFINEEAFRHIDSVYLQMDFIIAMVHASLLSVGCHWVMLSDIVRWMNEDRFFIGKSELASTGRMNKKRAMVQTSILGGMPLYEYTRMSLWFWQSIAPPVPNFRLDITKLFSRYLFDLNLPTDFMECITVLYDLFPLNNEISQESLRCQGDILEGFPLCQLKKDNNVQNCFRRNMKSAINDIFFSLETKIMAYILLALKLRFSLDDSENEYEPGTFNIPSYVYQLKLRLLHMDGHNATDILQRSEPFIDHKIKPEFGHGGNVRVSSKQDVYVFKNKGRDAMFWDSCPSVQNLEQFDMLPPYLPPELCKKPDRSERGNRILFSPLRYQTNAMRDYLGKNRTPEEKDEIRKRIDDTCLKLFMEDFGMYDLNSSGNSTWNRCFPNSNEFKRYPRPLWAQGCIYTYNTRHNKKFKSKIDVKCSNGPCSVFVSRKACSDAFTAASPYMSNTFKTLLNSFATLIGELDIVLYSCYMMLELMVVDHGRYTEIANNLVEGSTIPLTYALFENSGVSRSYNGRISAYHEVDSVKEIKMYKLGIAETYADPSTESLESTVHTGFSASDSSSNSSNDKTSDDSSSDTESSCSSQDIPINTTSQTVPVSLTPDQIMMSSRHQRMLFSTRAYDWDTVWHILATKYW